MLSATLSLGLVLLLTYPICAQVKPNRRLLDGLFGPIHTSRTEIASVTERDGANVEGPRTLVMSVEYNDDWTRAVVRTYRPDGSTSHKTLYTYDPEGRWSEIAYYVLRSSSMNKTEENGGKAESAFYNADGSVANRSVMRRNEEGNWEHSEYKADGAVSSRTVSISDGKGWGSELQEYNGEGVLIRKQTYNHEYDSHGNWTKETEWHWESETGKSTLVSIRYRAISYYGTE